MGSPKTGGRQKGTPNRSTLNLYESFAASGFDVPSEIMKLMPKLSPTLRMKSLLELMSYLYPKRKAVESQIMVSSTAQNDLTEEDLQIAFSSPETAAAALVLADASAKFYSKT